MLKRLTATFFALMLLCVGAVGCASQQHEFLDGTYRAERADYDTWGYRPYLVVTVTDGRVTAIEYDALDVNGALRSQDADYQKEMEAVQGTYPQRYTADLINQYLEQQDIEKVDAVAGATDASAEFTTMFTALEANMESGDTSTLIV